MNETCEGGLALTHLFVPAHDERKSLRALESPVDAVVFDLEAGVPERQKCAARQAIGRYVSLRRDSGPQVWVRVNHVEAELDADIAGIDWASVHGAVVARAEDPAVLARLERAGVTALMPLIESVSGFSRLDDIAAIRSVRRFAIGTWDLALDLRLPAGMNPDDSELIWRLRGDLVLASRRLSLASPVDGICAELDNPEQLRVTAERAYRLGYSGKLLIHPKQIAVVHSVFTADRDALRRAREIVAAYEQAVSMGRGVIQYEHQMIDLPMVEQYRALLTRNAFSPELIQAKNA